MTTDLDYVFVGTTPGRIEFESDGRRRPGS
jgi:hypothetical protein